MPSAFNFSASPFDCLTPQEQGLVRRSIDIAYFLEGATILDVGDNPTHLFVIIKGYVQQSEGSETIATYGPDDCFDGRGLVAGRVSSRFVASEEVLAYQLTKEAVSELIARNATFGSLLFSDLSNKLSALSQRQSQHQLRSLAMARVDEAFVRPPHFVDADQDILSVVKVFQAQRTASVLVRDPQSQPPRLGIFTRTCLQRAILDGRPLDQLPVRGLANFSLIKIRPSDQLGDALAALIRHKVHRLVVVRELAGSEGGEEVVGILESLDLFSFLSNHSYLISLQIDDASDLESLGRVALKLTRLIELLQRSGTKVSMIATLVQELNAKLFERTWTMLAPPELVENSCLFVMGSEGRGEQLLKTDQDNGLILRDGYEPPADLDAICQRFSEALGQFGYPPCPGNIMLSNPEWRGSASGFAQKVREWLILPSPESLMALAIFVDAHSVCGDAQLLEGVRDGLFQLVTDNDAMLGRFASAMDAFPESGGWWNRLLARGDSGEEQLDLKKAGIFPLVHGVRSLALAAHLKVTSTTDRIAALVALGRLNEEMGRDLTDSLHFFMGLKLKAGLDEIATGRPVSGAVEVARLSSLDRDLLKDTLGVVKRFKTLMRQRFHLDVL